MCKFDVGILCFFLFFFFCFFFCFFLFVLIFLTKWQDFKLIDFTTTVSTFTHITYHLYKLLIATDKVLFSSEKC